MPSFEIPDGPTSVALKSEGGFHKGSAVFGVTNRSGEGLTARLSVQVQVDGKAEWYQVQGEPERAVPAGETQTVTVVARIPGAAPPGQHRIKLRAINVNDPDNDSTDSAAAIVTIPAAAKPDDKPKKPFPWWIVAVVAGVLALVIGGVVAIVLLTGGAKVPDVVGKPYLEAKAALAEAGYETTTRTDRQTGDKPSETILAQAPAAGEKLKTSQTVALTVAIAAPPPPPVEEPPIVEEAEANCDPAVGTCIDGFVWRMAGPNDRVCVTPESRDLVAQENVQHPSRRSPTGGPYGPNTCLSGFVWRDAYVGDQICVTGDRRSYAARENQAGPSRHRACRPRIVIPKPTRPRITLPTR